MRQTRGIVSKIRADVRQELWPQKSELTADNNYCFKSQHSRQTRDIDMNVSAGRKHKGLVHKSRLTTHKSYGSRRWRHTRVMEVSADDRQEVWSRNSALTTDKSYSHESQRWRQTRSMVTEVSADKRYILSRTSVLTTDTRHGNEFQRWRQTLDCVSVDDKYEVWSRKSTLKANTRYWHRNQWTSDRWFLVTWLCQCVS